jgi:hypothetical protein
MIVDWVLFKQDATKRPRTPAGEHAGPEDAGKRGADDRNPDLAFGGETGRSAEAQMYASSLLPEY